MAAVLKCHNKGLIFNNRIKLDDDYLDYRLAQWSEYSPIAQGVAGSIPAQYKHLCA
jgi:hypothetical protein